MSEQHMSLELPITAELRTELEAAELYMHTVRDNGKLSDRDNFAPTVEVLSNLTGALLASFASAPLTKAGVDGARIRFGSSSQIHSELHSTLAYLRYGTPVTGVKLSEFNSGHVAEALGQLAALHGKIMYAVADGAKADLTELRMHSVASALMAAEALAQLVSEARTSSGRK